MYVLRLTAYEIKFLSKTFPRNDILIPVGLPTCIAILNTDNIRRHFVRDELMKAGLRLSTAVLLNFIIRYCVSPFHFALKRRRDYHGGLRVG